MTSGDVRRAARGGGMMRLLALIGYSA